MTRKWEEVEALLDEAAGLNDEGLLEWLSAIPEGIREQARAMLEPSPIFGPWAAEAAARIVLSTPRLSLPCTLSHYHVLRRIGEGGMGEVYEADDPRLKRKVAIKVLRAGAVRRLEEEAQALARLRHPNICRIYDVGGAGEIEYFVMELLDGVPLSERLRKRPVLLAEALSIGCAVASALAEAHRIGIVHRDVKPANILLTRNGPSLVDFGISDIAGSGGSVPAGTPPYMAPEQMRGVSDPRSDVYSAGAVLRELTGENAPKTVREVIELCLRENPDDRWQSAADLAHALKWLAEPVGTRAPVPWWRRWWVGYAAAAAVAIASAGWMLLPIEKPRSPVMIPLRGPRDFPIRFEQQIALAPDGLRIAMIGRGEGDEPLVFLRKLNETAGQPIPATAGASLVFWSPDGESIGLVRGRQLQTLHLASGTLRTLADVPVPARSGLWSEDGHIVYACDTLARQAVIYRVSTSGGPLRRITELNDAEEEHKQGFPVLLRGGKQFLFVAGSNKMAATLSDPGHTYLADYDNPRRRTLLLRGAVPTGAAGDRIYYIQEDKLWSRRLNVNRGEWIGERRVEIDGVRWAKVHAGGLIYAPLRSKWRPAWVDRAGRQLADLPVPEGRIIGVGLSPDGKAFVTRYEEQSPGIGLWVVRGSQAERIGSGPGRYVFPTWSADSRWIYFASYDATGGVYRRLPVAGADEELLMERGREDKVITTIASGGIYALGVGLDPATNHGFDIFRFDVRTRTRQDWSATEASETQPALSPDGRWVAWVYNERSRSEGGLYVSPRDEPRNRTLAAGRGASFPTWSRDGRDLYFAMNDWLCVVPVSFRGGKFLPGKPERLFRMGEQHFFGTRYAVESKNRFLVSEAYRQPPDPILVWNPRE